DSCSVPRVLTPHEPVAKVDRDLLDAHQGLARLIYWHNLFAWKRFEQAIITQVQAVVVFTEPDRQALVPFAAQTPIVRIPLGMELPERPLNPLGTPRVILLFVGNFWHPPDVLSALRLTIRIFPCGQ